MNKLYRVIPVILLLALCASVGFTAAHLYDLSGVDIQVSEATAAKRIIYVDVSVAEAQVVTVSKAGGGFGATAGTTCTAVAGTMYKLTMHIGDLDTEGFLAFLSTGATDNTTVYNIMVVDHDPFDAVVEIAAGVGTSPVRVNRAQVQRSEVDADRRTIYFYATGTLPAYASVSKNGAAFANSTNAPATVNGSFRSLEFTRAELAAVGRYVVNVTTTGTVATAFIVVDVTADDVFARSGLGPR